MGATRRDVSGIFDKHLGTKFPRKAAVLDRAFDLTPKGMTFVTDTFMPEWMEVGVEMRLPVAGGARRDCADIGCRGVVVQCERRAQGKGFEVVLMFLDLPKRAQARLGDAPSHVAPLCISISR